MVVRVQTTTTLRTYILLLCDETLNVLLEHKIYEFYSNDSQLADLAPSRFCF